MAKAMKKLSFDKKVFRSLIPYTLIGVVFVLLYSMSFVRFHKSDLLPAAGLTALFAAFGQLILGPVCHRLSISRLSEKMEYYASGQMDIKERTDLIKELMRFPLRKAAWTELIFLSCTIGVSFAFHALTDFSLRYTYLFLIVSTLSTYIGFIFSLDNTQKLCSAEAEKIAEEGVDTETVDKEHFFGLSLFSLFTLYVFIPMVLCSVFTLLSVIFLKQPRKLILISITNILIISSMTLLFFRRIKKNSWTMERALFDLMRTSGGSAKSFPTDFASEMSYFAYLFNKTILLFRGLINDMSQVNTDINESTVALSTISTETASTSTEQYSTSNEILATMKGLNASLSEVESKADEVLKVARTTSEQVNGNFETLRQNSDMMKDIKESNGETINGIQSLSNKISNIQDIVNLITTVTAQTKIIAFNAELEANSIGTEGADFQNVATDIRALADSTIKLTNEIQDSIHDINKSKDNLITTGKDFIQRINEGSFISDQLEQNFYNIQRAASETADEAQDIQQSVPEQILSFRQIEGALQDINSRLNVLNDSTHKISLSIDKLKVESGNLATMMLNMEGGI
ncbi:MAG: methyl-accepting chemotaxis protein [Treponema sp.]|nr:methyl-accepting chemotaxis protein [Treponema sp.]